MHSSSVRLYRTLILAVGFVVASACGDSGCGALTPLEGRFTGPKVDNTVNIRLNGDGVTYLNTNWRALIESFAPGQRINVPAPCSIVDLPGLVPTTVSDQGGANGVGRSDGICDGRDIPANVEINIVNFELKPRPPDQVEVALSLRIVTDMIQTSTVSHSGACLWTAPLKCELRYDTGLNAPGETQVDATARLTIDTKWDKLLAFSITGLDGASICGADGAAPIPRCLDADDMFIGGANTCGNIECGALDWSWLKGWVLRTFVAPRVDELVRSMLSTVSCEPCGAGKRACPTGSSCQSTTSICMDTATNKCVPRFLGVEGKLTPSRVFDSIGIPESASIDLSIAAGSSAVVDRGMTLGTRGGFLTGSPAACVRAAAAPVVRPVSSPNFDAAAKKPYQFAVGLSSSYLNLAFHHMHQSGALCLDLGDLDSPLMAKMNTGLFGLTTIPSIQEIAKRDGKHAPMKVAFRPKQAPTLTLGEGTKDSPHLMLNFQELNLDIYALLEDRYVRLLAITTDLQVPLSLIPIGCSQVEVVLGDLSKLVARLDVARGVSEVLAESPEEVRTGVNDVLNVVLSFAGSQLKEGTLKFSLPEVLGFQLRMSETRALNKTSSGYSHLGVFARLAQKGSACLESGPQLQAQLLGVQPADANQRWPGARVAVSATGASASTMEYAYRFDDGIWMDFSPAVGGFIETRHPALTVEGKHRLEVRGRSSEQPGAVSQPVAMIVLMDRTAPQLQFQADEEQNLLKVDVVEEGSAQGSLLYSYRVGEGAWSAEGPARPIDLSAVRAAGGVGVRVRDENGNVGEAHWTATVAGVSADETSGTSFSGASGDGASGCGATGSNTSSMGIALLFLGWLWSSRRRSSSRRSSPV